MPKVLNSNVVSKDVGNTAKTYYNGVGRRKSSVARVFLALGNGTIEIRRQKCEKKAVAIEEYFSNSNALKTALTPLEVMDMRQRVSIVISVDGGGISGQAGAIKLGIARALLSYDESLRKELRVAGCLTRDAREVQRKIYGRRKARKKKQYSKR